MRKIVLQHDSVRGEISMMVGQNIKLVVNRGRRKVEKYIGKLVSAYPSVFTVAVEGVKSVKLLTYSYSDVVCGDVKIEKK